MKIIAWSNDIPIAFSSNKLLTGIIPLQGIELLDNRINLNGELVNPNDFITFYIDDKGVKHIYAALDWQEVQCVYSDVLIRVFSDNGWVWRIKNIDDIKRETILLNHQKINSMLDKLFNGSASSATVISKRVLAAKNYMSKYPDVGTQPITYITYEASVLGLTDSEYATAVIERNDDLDRLLSFISAKKAEIIDVVNLGGLPSNISASLNAILDDVNLVVANYAALQTTIEMGLT